jgi:protein tyrosine phosphatase (PTP) superfamily phosphohydrolase (DUF442 family)
MQRRLSWLATGAMIVVTVGPGCQHCCRKTGPSCPPNQLIPAGPGGAPPAFTDPGFRSTPPGAVIAPPPPSPVAPPPPSPISSTDTSGSSPVAALPPDGTWHPAPRSEVRLALPEPPNTQAADNQRLVPQPLPPGPAAIAPQPKATTPPLPVGIPGYAMAKDRVAAGLKPYLDGLDWLQANGYKTVLHLRKPGENDSADRQLVERRGMAFVSLEVSPDLLTRDLADRFNRAVTEATNLPLFVYDENGLLSGALWYLHFRVYEGLPDAEAREKAARVGLRPDGDGEHRTVWLAIQKLLSEQGRQ